MRKLHLKVLFCLILAVLFNFHTKACYIELLKPGGEKITTNNDFVDSHPGYDAILSFLKTNTNPAYGPFADYAEKFDLLAWSSSNAVIFPIHPNWSIACKHVADSNRGKIGLNGFNEKRITDCNVKFNGVNLDLCLLPTKLPSNPTDRLIRSRKTIAIDNDWNVNKSLYVAIGTLHKANGQLLSYQGKDIYGLGNTSYIFPRFIANANLRSIMPSMITSEPFYINPLIKVRTYGGDSGAIVFTSTGKTTGSFAERFKIFGVMHQPAEDHASFIWLGHPEVYNWIKTTINNAGIGPRMPENPTHTGQDVIVKTGYTLIDPFWALASIRNEDQLSKDVLFDNFVTSKSILLSDKVSNHSLHLIKLAAKDRFDQATLRPRNPVALTQVGPYSIEPKLNAQLDKMILSDALGQDVQFEQISRSSLSDPNFKLIDPEWALISFESVAAMDAALKSTKYKWTGLIKHNIVTRLLLVRLPKLDILSPVEERSRDYTKPTKVGSFTLEKIDNDAIDNIILMHSLLPR